MPGGIHPPLEVIASWPKPNYVDPPTRSWGLVILTLVLASFSILVVSLRLYTRAKITNNWGTDDWLILIAMPPTLGVSVAICLGSKMYYFDRHAWDVPIPEGLIETRKIAFVIELLYVIGVGLIKISILFFYKRLSSDILPKSIVWSLWATIAFVIAYMITFTFTLVGLCKPVSAYWLQLNPYWAATHEYTCHSEPGDLLAATIISVIQDFIVAGIPTLIFARMDIPFRQKLAMAAVFAVGFFTCITGVLRLVYIYRIFFVTYDVTWEADKAWAWTAVEASLAAIVASVPSLKIFVQRHLESIASGSWGYTFSSGSRSRNRASARASRRGSGPAWAWTRASSRASNRLDCARGRSDSETGNAVPLERVAERPSKENEGRPTSMLQARKITAEDVARDEYRRQQLARQHNRHRGLTSHPTVRSPNREKHPTWLSSQSEYSMSMTASVDHSEGTEGKGFDPDAYALPILTEQDTRDMGLVGVAQ